MHTYKDVLPNLPLMAGICMDDIEPMLNCLGAAVRSYQKNEFVFRAGDPVAFVGIVLTGRLYLIKEFYHGKTSLYKCYEPYESFGESIVCSRLAASPLSVKAVKNSTILCLPLSKLFNHCPRSCTFHSHLIDNLLQTTAAKNLNMFDKFAITAKKSIRERLITYLIQLSRQQNSRGIEVPLSRTELAAYLEVDRAALSREIRRLQNENCLYVNKNNFTLLKHCH